MIIILLILINTVAMSFDRYPISESEFYTLESINMVLFSCFFAEMIIKLLGMGIKDYLRDKFNIFDATIVFLSTLELI
jgi:hypothetical protein